jgi:hypothetical protein
MASDSECVIFPVMIIFLKVTAIWDHSAQKGQKLVSYLLCG